MADYFFDTSVLIAYFKEEDLRTAWLLESIFRADATAMLSAVTVAEVCSASDMSDLRLRTKRLATLDLFEVVALDRTIAVRGGELRREYNLALPDAMIAASAEQAGGRFLSKDSHFNRLLKAGRLIGEVYS